MIGGDGSGDGFCYAGVGEYCKARRKRGRSAGHHVCARQVDDVPRRDLDRRVSAVLRFDPIELRRFVRAPAVRTRALAAAVERDRDVLGEREVRQLLDEGPVAVP